MTCPSPVVQSMYADGALAADDALRFERHAAACAACSSCIAALRREHAALRAALRHDADAVPVPRFAPARARELWALVLGLAAAGMLGNAFWSAAAAAVPSGLRWLNPLQPGELYERALGVVTFVAYEGAAMWTTALNYVGIALLAALFAWATVAAARGRGFAAAAAAVLAVVVALPSIGHALERRNGELVTLAAGETIDDTLFAAGQTIAIDGNVNGDLLAFGRTVTVRGNVAGNVIAAGEAVTVDGTVGGSVIGAGRGLSLARARVGGNVYGFGRDVAVAATAEVVGNAVAFGESVGVDGRVGADLLTFGNTVAISGAVQGDVEGYASSLTLLPSARVGGNVTAHVDAARDLSVAAGAVVGGRADAVLVEREQRRNEYLTVGYYVRQIVRLGAAFLTGLLLLWLFPVLRDVSLPTAGAVLRAGGIGLAAAVTLPVAALLVCFTVVGIPIGVLMFALGAMGLYFGKTVLAQIVGRSVFRTPQGPPHYAATLFTGLVIVVVAINLPLVGGLANVALTLVGFGLIVTLLLARFTQSPAA